MTNSKEATVALDWEEVLEEADEPITWRYAEWFQECAERAQEEKESAKKKAFKLLAKIASPRLNVTADDGPLPGLEKLSDKDFSDLSDLLKVVDDPELRARISDVIWVQNREYESAEAAVEAYLHTAERLEGDYNNRPALLRFRRALILALQLGNEDLQDDVVGALESHIRDRANSETWWYSLNYSELLYEHRLGEPENQARLMTACAENVEQHFETEETVDSDLVTAKDYHLLAAKWHDRAGNDEESRRSRIEGAELLIRKAESAPMQMNAVTWYRQALRLYRPISRTDDRTEEVRELMLEAQNNIREEMTPRSWDPSNPDLQERARDYVGGLSLQAAMTRMALGISPPSSDEVEETVRKKVQENPFKALIPMEEINEMGHTISKKPGGFDSEDESMAYLQQREMTDVRTRVAVNFIRPTREKIKEDHYVRRTDLVEFARYSMFVAEGRLLSMSKGILAGFREDWVTVVHFLAPQVEAALRHLLRRRGVITTSLDSQDIQEQKSLNRMLKEDSLRKPLEEMCGKDVVFDLEGLLNESSGANLRNLVAHGLGEDGSYWSPQVEYLWWMVIRLIALFSLNDAADSSMRTDS